MRSVVLKVMDTVTGRDITENGEAGGAELYLFGPTGEYTGHVSVTSDEIMHRIPVMLPERNLAGCRISAWTNVGAGQQFHIPDDGSRLENRAVSLFMEDDTYHGVPDNLFFGQLQASAGTGMPEEVTVVRKNAQMHITVRDWTTECRKSVIILPFRRPTTGMISTGSRWPVRQLSEGPEHSVRTAILRP